MKKRLTTFWLTLVFGIFGVGGELFIYTPSAAAASYSYNPSYLISDQIFADYGSMSVTSIQNFLNAENSGIKNYSDTEDCASSPRYSSFTSFYQAHYHCGSSESVAQIIYDVAHAYQISPKAILATMQKEQSLVTDPTAPSQNMAAINCAMGYDSCSDDTGFFHQVDWGAWQFRANIELMNGRSYWNYAPSSYPCSGSTSLYSTGLYPGRSVTFANPHYTGDPYSSSQPRTVTLATSATASLYCYTPYVGPYDSNNVLNYPGTGYSGSFNFVIYFEAWFGSPFSNTSGDQPFVGDWNGDGKDTIAIRRGNQFFFDFNNDGNADCHFTWGQSSDPLIVGDWDGNGTDNIGLKEGNTYYLNTDCIHWHAYQYHWGRSTDTPIVGDFNGDGKSDIALKRGNRYFYDFNQDGHEEKTFLWGNSSDTPFVGAWDYCSNALNAGKKVDKIALRRANVWFFDCDNDSSITNNSSAHADKTITWGDSKDNILVGDWNGDGKDNIGIKRSTSYYLDTDFVHGEDIPAFTLGKTSDKARIGDWDESGAGGRDSIGVVDGGLVFLDNNFDGQPDIDYTYFY